MKVVPLTRNDILIDTSKTTTGYFSGGVGTLAGSNFTTSSLSATQKLYYYTLQYNSEDHFGCSFGHIAGSGSSQASLNAGVGETQAIYKSFASKLLRSSDIVNGFQISGSGDDTEDYVWILVAERAKMKDRLNAGNWTLALSGSVNEGSVAATGSSVFLTDDSKTNVAYASPVGPRYNIVSGTTGTVNTAASVKRYGFFWPELGTMVFSGRILSQSLGGPHSTASPAANTSGSVNLSEAGTNFSPVTTVGGNNALKLASSIALGGTVTPHKFRSEEDQTTVSYFCRALSREFNHSSNPTAISGSEGRFTIPEFESNPQTFITTIGLHNTAGEMVAVGRLSAPIQKNYSKESIIKVKLTY